jgi:outer membrane protein insertion porin family
MRKSLILIILILLFSFCLTYAQSRVISKIEVEGNRTVDPSLVIKMSGLLRGMELDPYLVQDAIRRVYAMGLFSDIQIKGQETMEGITVTMVVKEYPRLTRIEIEGNKKIKKDDIFDKLKLIEGKLISPTEVKDEVKNIKSIYEEKGYLLAQVESEISESVTPGEVVLKFKIKEGRKVKIKKIYIEGNQVFSDGKVRKQMKNKQDSFFRSGEFDPEKYEEDKEKIVEFYQKEGYLDAEVVSDSIWYDPSRKDMFIQIRVFEGPQYIFGKVSWEGNKRFSDDILKKAIKFEEGKVYDQEKYDKALEELHALYLEEGYLYAQILDETKTRGNVVDINYFVSEGITANIRKINIVGNTKTREKVIRRELCVKPGQKFRRSLLMRSLRDVMYLNYFGNVLPDYEVLDNGDIDLILKVEEKPTGQFSFGAGYSELNKLVGTIGLGTPNLFGRGQTLQLSWEFGKTVQNYQLSFTEPWFLDTPTSVGFDIYNTNQNWYDEFTEQRKGIGLRLGRRLSWPDDYFRLFVRYRLENVRYFDFETYTDTLGVERVLPELEYLTQIKWPQRTSSFDFTIIRDSRDLPQFATSGSVMSWNAEFAGGLLGGDWSYHKHIFLFYKYIPSFWKFVLVAKAKFGVIDTYTKGGSVPYSERFTPGGIDSDGIIRGYADGTVGPKDESGYLIRGRSVLVYNFEYQFPIVEQQIYGLLLADMGNAYLKTRDVQPLAFKNLYKSVGFGVRLVVPNLGMIGFDMAYGFDYPDPLNRDHGEWRPHFNFGTSF